MVEIRSGAYLCRVLVGVVGLALVVQAQDQNFTGARLNRLPSIPEFGTATGFPTFRPPRSGLTSPSLARSLAFTTTVSVEDLARQATRPSPLQGAIGANPFEGYKVVPKPERRSTCVLALSACGRIPRASLVPDTEAVSGSAPTFGYQAEGGQRQVSWKLVIPNFLNDQKHIWLFPFGSAERHPVPTLAVIGTTGALIALDQVDTPYFRRTNNFGTFAQVFKVTTTERVFLGLPVAYYLAGLARHDNYAEQTAFFAAEALADVDLLAGVMRSVDGRLHPRDIPADGDYVHTWLKAPGAYVNRGGFPSGHTAGAFAVATVFARRYGRQHRWVPIVAYGLAGLTALERITSSAHFPSDVFVGGALSYGIARFVVLREER